MNQTDTPGEDGPPPWLLVNIAKEKEAEVSLFRRRLLERARADPDTARRWRAECEHYEPDRTLLASWHQVENENYLRELAEQRCILDQDAAKIGWFGDIVPRRDRIIAYSNARHAFAVQLRDIECLCEANAELARARCEAADPDVADPQAARRWLGLYERYERIVAECWRVERERRDREVSERECSKRTAMPVADSDRLNK